MQDESILEVPRSTRSLKGLKGAHVSVMLRALNTDHLTSYKPPEGCSLQRDVRFSYQSGISEVMGAYQRSELEVDDPSSGHSKTVGKPIYLRTLNWHSSVGMTSRSQAKSPNIPLP